MAYDEALARRLRNGLAGVADVTERRMMGGLCLFLNGNMLATVNRPKGGADRFMFRVGAAAMAEALGRPGAAPAVMGDRTMGGFVFVDAAAVDDAALAGWLALARGFVEGLPAK